MRLLVLAPQVAFRDCNHCKAFVYQEETGEPAAWMGKPIVRHAGCPPPCRTSAGCAKGVPTGEKGCKELTPKNMAAYIFHKECEAVGRWPDDATVRRNASLIRMAEESAKEARIGQRLGALAPLAALLRGLNGGR